MAATKDYFDKIVENQNKLVTTITDYTTEAVDAVMPDNQVTEKTEKLLKEMMDATISFAENLGKKETMEKFQQDFWGAMTENYSKGFKLSMDLYEKSMEFWKDLWMVNKIDSQQERMKKFSEMYQNYWKTYLDVTKDNSRVIQDFFKDSAMKN